MPRKKKPVVHGFGKYKLQINSLYNVIDTGHHNAFVDLCLWKGMYYLAYRRADWHDPKPPGDVVVCQSVDAFSWEEVAILDTGGDDRDPKFIATDSDFLMLYWGTYYERWQGKTLTNSTRDLITCGSQSRNGKVWSTPYQIYRPNYWMWTTQKGYNGYTYGMAYHFGGDFSNSLQLLFKSKKRFATWETIAPALNAQLDYTDLSEPALFSTDMLDENFVCIARTSDCTLIGESEYPYTKWKWHEQDVICHCPVALKAAGKIFVAGRTRLDCIPGLSGEDAERAEIIKKNKKSSKDWYIVEEDKEDIIPKGKPRNWLDDVYRCVLFEYDTKKHALNYQLTLPSSRDCAYPGMAWDPNTNELVIAYYSQHDHDPQNKGIPRPANIYVARIGVNDEEAIAKS